MKRTIWIVSFTAQEQKMGGVKTSTFAIQTPFYNYEDADGEVMHIWDHYPGVIDVIITEYSIPL